MNLMQEVGIRRVHLAAVLWVLPGAAVLAADRPGVFFTDANRFELLTGNAGIAFDLKLQFPITRSGFAVVSPVAGDWDGDGLDSIGAYDHLANQFHLRDENTPGFDDVVVPFGEGGGGDQGPAIYPLTGDWNSDGVDTIGTYDNVGQRFQLRNTNSEGEPDLDFMFGFAGSRPVSGDFDGDGQDTIGVYTPGDGTFHLRNSNSAGVADIVAQFGPSDSLPVIGDWDGDGADTIGVLDTEANELWLRNTNAPGPPDIVIPLREARWSWLPISGNWHLPAEYPPEPGFPWIESTPEAENINAEQLAAAYQQAALNEALYALLVVRHGKLVAEDYFGGYQRDMGGNVKSVSKSVLSGLTGIALRDGYFSSLEQTVASIMPELFASQADPRKFDITLEHLVTMTSGLTWSENSLGSWYYSQDPHQYVIDQPMTGDPGTDFLYSTGLTHLSAALLTRVTGVEPPEFATPNLFAPLGISVQRWDVDLQGDYIGGAEFYFTPRDMARFGQLYLRYGTLEGNEIVPAEWVDWSTSELVPESWVPGSRSYAAWWWRDGFADHEAYFAWGYGGQFIFVVQNLDLVVVANSDWTVSQQAAGAQASAVFNLLSNWILPAVCADPAGDVDHDGDVDAADLAALLGAWGASEPCPPPHAADLDHDCDVDAQDLAVLLASWTG